jgi:hypothetical protein
LAGSLSGPKITLLLGAELSGRSLAYWVKRDLHAGDLGFLKDFALFRNRPPPAVVERLCERGFMAKTNGGRGRMTLKGWIAILLRKAFARKKLTQPALCQAKK